MFKILKVANVIIWFNFEISAKNICTINIWCIISMQQISISSPANFQKIVQFTHFHFYCKQTIPFDHPNSAYKVSIRLRAFNICQYYIRSSLPFFSQVTSFRNRFSYAIGMQGNTLTAEF